MAAAQIFRSSNPRIECMVAQNHILSDPDGGGTDPQILKPWDIVHGGTESHVGRSGWWRHRSSDPQTLGYTVVHGGTESHVVRSGYWRHRFSSHQTQGYSAWRHRIPYCQIRIAAAQILISPPRISSKCWAALNCVLKIGPLLQDPWTWREQELFSATECMYTIPVFHVICCCMLPCTFFTNCEGVMHYYLSLSYNTTFFADHQIQLCVMEDAGIEPSTVSACSDSHTHPPSAKPHQR
jgi:hypothetical protein